MIVKVFTVATKDISSESNTFLVLGVLAVVLVCVYNSIRRNLRSLRTNEVDINSLPGPKPSVIPLVGNAFELLPVKNVFHTLQKWSGQYGQIMQVSIGGKSLVWLNSPLMIKKLLQSSDMGHLDKASVFYDQLHPLVNTGVLVSKGLFWKSQKKIIMRSMSFNSLRGYTTLLNVHSKRLVLALETMFGDNQFHMINKLVEASFFEVICEIITGVDLHNTEEGYEFHLYLQRAKETITERFLYPYLLIEPIWKLSSTYRRQTNAFNSLKKVTEKFIAIHSETKNRNGSYDENGNKIKSEENNLPFKTLLDELIDGGVPKEQIMEELNVMIIAGHETTASTVSLFCFQMALNPKFQKKCQEEIDAFWNDASNFDSNGVTYDSLRKLEFLEWCIQETMRLYPAIFLYGRNIRAPLVIDDDKVLPAGTDIFVCPWALHRNPEYFPEPEKFDPYRFTAVNRANQQPFSYIPFSAGMRNCLGYKFAMIEMKMTTAYILRNLFLSTTDTMETVSFLPNIFLTPQRGHMLQMSKRLIE